MKFLEVVAVLSLLATIETALKKTSRCMRPELSSFGNSAKGQHTAPVSQTTYQKRSGVEFVLADAAEANDGPTDSRRGAAKRAWLAKS